MPSVNFTDAAICEFHPEGELSLAVLIHSNT